MLEKGYKETEVGMIPGVWEVIELGSGLSKPPSYGLNAPAVLYSDQLPTYIRELQTSKMMDVSHGPLLFL